MVYGGDIYYPKTTNVSMSSSGLYNKANSEKTTTGSDRSENRKSVASEKTVMNGSAMETSRGVPGKEKDKYDIEIPEDVVKVNTPEFKGSNYKKKFETSVHALSQLKHQNKAWRDVAENRLILLHQVVEHMASLKQQLQAISNAVLDAKEISYLESSIPCSTDGIGMTTHVVRDVETCKEYSNLLYDRIKSADDSVAYLAQLVEEEMNTIPVAHIDLEIPSHLSSTKHYAGKVNSNGAFGMSNPDDTNSLFSGFDSNYTQFEHHDISREIFSSINDSSDDFLV